MAGLRGKYLLVGAALAAFAAACFMVGCFFMCSACCFRSAIVPITISCITAPLLTTTKRTVSPRLTLTREGVKRI